MRFVLPCLLFALNGLPVRATETPPPHPTRLTLIAPDGSPAAGWFVAPNAHVTSMYSSVGGLNGPPIHVYGADRPVAAGPGGVASFRQSTEHLLVFSPHGLPLLYPLHPQTWTSAEHRVTLRLPPVRRTQAGRLTAPDGRPAADFPLRVSHAHTGTYNWELGEDAPAGLLLTDAQGGYALPQYFGTGYGYDAGRPGYYAHDLATDHAALTMQEAPPGPQDRKRITLAFVDEQGKPLPEIGVDLVEGYAGLSPGTDARGIHLLLRKGTARAVIKTQSHRWGLLTKALEMPGGGDLTFTLTMPESLRFKPLGGVVLGADGRPVAGVTIMLKGINPRPQAPNNEYLGFLTKTDVRGRFAFAAAPPSCEIDLYRFAGDSQPNLPGWTDPPLVTPGARAMTIRLKPVGSVRALVPPFVAAIPDRTNLKGRDYHSPHLDRQAHALHWSAVPPGDYALLMGGAGGDKTLTRVRVRAGQETAVDLRGWAAAFPRPMPPVTTRIVVTSPDGNPVSGASVTLWTEGPAWGVEPPADLTDDDGTVRLPLGRGQTGVAVAHLAGRMIGWGDVTGADGQTLSIGVGPAKTLAVHLPALPLVDGKAPYDDRAVRLHPTGLSPRDARAVFSVLGVLDADAFSVRLDRDEEGTWAAQDLPTGPYRLETESDVMLTDSDLPVVAPP